ncbi:MAG TPA: DnaJ family domain-containing protein [Burkholderiales bacterium]|nr:DnaJ family domain-containing protein [Burkholderiales bacterium]
MSGLDMLAEQRIREAQAQGAFDDLPGAGAPLDLNDDALVPEELRAAYRILKNAGYAPAEIEALRDLREVELALERERNDAQRNVLIGKLNVLLTRAGLAHRRNLAIDNDYFQKVAEKLARRRR